MFFRQGRQGNPFWGIFFQNLQENSFFARSCPRTFPHCRPLQPPFPRGNVENSVETVKNPCPHAGFHFPPVFTMAFVYVNEPAYFSFLERKSPFFCLENTPKIQAESGLCPPYLVSSGKGQISFPQFVHRDLTYISYLALGPSAPAGKPCKPKETPMQFPDFVVY